MTDPISDMLTRIKNGYMAKKSRVHVPYSKFKESLAKLLYQYDYVGEVSKDETTNGFNVELVYPEGRAAMTEVKRMSKPGLRRYVSVKELENIRQGLGFVIVSTPKGLMTHVQAKKERLGGEVICKIW